MEKKEIEEFKKKVENISLKDLKNKELMEELSKLNVVIEDIFRIVNFKKL